MKLPSKPLAFHFPCQTSHPQTAFYYFNRFKIPFFLRQSSILGDFNFRFSGSCYRCLSICDTLKVTASTTMDSLEHSVQVKEKIDLTETEKKIFDRLLLVLRDFNLQTQLRVAGGWVRDKLMGIECHDIDIALDNMLGKEFCEKVNKHLSAAGEEIRGIGVIQCNPDQSKHLETARMHLFDMWIDFVNLRAEDYSENSRIPTMRFGTVEEDAFRRDLTINSLFYNINTGSVEDLTRRGISDLKSGKIVTPLPPKQTFLDDPLRVFRAIRFGARFNFVLDEDLKVAGMDDDVKTAIRDKISRERIGHDIDLMISGNRPVDAMTYVSELKLFWVAFALPPEMDPPISKGCERFCVSYMNSCWRFLLLIGYSSFSIDQRRLTLYAALFLHLRKTVYGDSKGKKFPVTRYIFGTSLKLKTSDAETVISMHIAMEKFMLLIPSILSCKNLQILKLDWKKEMCEVPDVIKLRISAGLLLREIKEFWRSALVLSVLVHPENDGLAENLSNSNFELNERAEIFNKVEKAIMELGLDNIWNLKPLVNGKDIMNVLELKSGPVVKEWQHKLLEWQLAHPYGSTDECIDWMKQSQQKRPRMD